MKTKFRELHFRRRSTLHKIGEFYLSDPGRKPQFGQNSILARSKAKIWNWKIINCFFIDTCQTLFTDKNEGKLFLVPKSCGLLLAGLPLNGNVSIKMSQGQLSYWQRQWQVRITISTSNFAYYNELNFANRWALSCSSQCECQTWCHSHTVTISLSQQECDTWT